MMSRVSSIVRPIPVIPVAVVVLVVMEPTPSPATTAVVTPISAATSSSLMVVTVLPWFQHRWRWRRLGAVRLELGVVLGEAVLELLLALVQEQLVLLGQDVDVSLWVDHFISFFFFEEISFHEVPFLA